MSEQPTGVAAALTAADIDARYQPTRTRARICLDSHLVLEIERLEEQLRAAISGDESAASPAGPLAEQIIALREQAKAAEVEFVFRSLGRRAFRDMVRAHPPTPEQVAEIERLTDGKLTATRNDDEFQPALLAASCEQPTGTSHAWWVRKCDEWGEGQLARLWEACLAANQGVADVPKAALAYGLTRTPDSKPE